MNSRLRKQAGVFYSARPGERGGAAEEDKGRKSELRRASATLAPPRPSFQQPRRSPQPGFPLQFPVKAWYLDC